MDFRKVGATILTGTPSPSYARYITPVILGPSVANNVLQTVEVNLDVDFSGVGYTKEAYDDIYVLFERDGATDTFTGEAYFLKLDLIGISNRLGSALP